MAANRLPPDDDERKEPASAGDDVSPDASPDSVLIHIRVPGPWTSPLEFEERLRDADGEYTIDEGRLLHRASGRRFDIGTSPHDDELVEVFAGDHHSTDDELDEIADHVVKLHLTGPGGSIDTARAIMDAATASVRAGGGGVMCDNSGVANGRADWLALAGDRQPGGLYWAFVSVTADANGSEIFSVGMHCLGFGDAELFDAGDREAGGFVLHNFLGYCYQSGVEVKDGESLGYDFGPAHRGVLYRANHVPCTRFPKGSSWFNPFGVWRLVANEEQKT